jgi:hypothetical protein
MTATAISAVVARRPAMLAGWVTGAVAHVRPWVRLDVAFCDETGSITLRFLGRTQILGIVKGCRLTVEGTPWMEGDSLVMLNPIPTSCSGGSAGPLGNVAWPPTWGKRTTTSLLRPIR